MCLLGKNPLRDDIVATLTTLLLSFPDSYSDSCRTSSAFVFLPDDFVVCNIFLPTNFHYNYTISLCHILLENLKPVVADLQVFSDKVARHPELLGVRGVVRGSDGSKDTQVTPASFER